MKIMETATTVGTKVINQKKYLQKYLKSEKSKKKKVKKVKTGEQR